MCPGASHVLLVGLLVIRLLVLLLSMTGRLALEPFGFLAGSSLDVATSFLVYALLNVLCTRHSVSFRLGETETVHTFLSHFALP